MPPIVKQKKPKVEIDYDAFNRFALKYKDYKGEPFFIMQWTQIVQNYKCVLLVETVLDAYRKSLK